MTTRWETARLAEVLTQDTAYITTPEAREYPKLSVKLYGRGVVLDAPTNGASLKMPRHQLAKPGQVILSEIWGKKGAIGIVPTEGDGALCTSHFFLFDVLNERMDARYLAWIFHANFLEDQLNVEARGTTGYAAVRPKHLLNCEIPLPPLAEQRRIVARIEDLAGEIQEAGRLRKDASVGTQALVASASRSLFGETPASDWVALRTYVAEIENGRSPQCETRPATPDEWGVLKVGSVSFGTFDESEQKALPVSVRFDPRYEVKPGDFLMSRANTTDLVGACAIVHRTRPKLLLSDKTFRLHFRRETGVAPEWMDYVLKSPALREQISMGASGTSATMKNISKEKVFGLLVPPHSPEQQREVIADLDALRIQTTSLHELQVQSTVELNALVPAILDRAFRGEV